MKKRTHKLILSKKYLKRCVFDRQWHVITCRKLPRLAQLRHSQTVGKFPVLHHFSKWYMVCQHILPRKVNYEFSKKFETAEIHIFNYPEIFKGMGKVLVCNSPHFH